MGEEPNKLRDFLVDNVHLRADAVGENEMVTEAIVMYRVVSMTGDTEFLPERVDFTNSKGCSFTMAIGIHEQVRSKWEYILAEANAQDHEEEEGDEPEGI